MMNENIKLFLKKVSENKELAEKFSAVKNPDEAYELASSIQSGFSKQEFFDAMLKIQSAVNTFNELSNEDLAKVAGGVETGLRVTLSTLMTSSASICAAAMA